jgi:hypothetical protein
VARVVLRVEYQDGHYEEATVLRPLGLETEVTQDVPVPILDEMARANALGASVVGPAIYATRVRISMEAAPLQPEGHLIRIRDSRGLPPDER